MKKFNVYDDRLYIFSPFESHCVQAPLGCVGVYKETRVPTQEIIGEWVQCPTCERIHVYSLDLLHVSNCNCDTPGVDIVRQVIRDDGYVSVVGEQELP